MERVKSIRELTEVEFNKLKESGLLKTIYPDAPETYKEIKGTRPNPIDNPDFKPLITLCEKYLDHLQDPENNYMKDVPHYIFETAIGCVYGNNRQSGIWDFINSNS